MITLVNRAWTEFSRQNGPQSAASTEVGTNYLAVREQASGHDADHAQRGPKG